MTDQISGGISAPGPATSRRSVSDHEGAIVPSGGRGCASGPSEDAGKKGCGTGNWVFARGEAGYDLISEPRRDSIEEAMGGPDHDPQDPVELLAYLKSHPWDAASIHWVLHHDRTPIYVILPVGPYAREAYEFLIQALERRTSGKTGVPIDEISVPGRLAGEAKLLDGTMVPVIFPERRGMRHWNLPEFVHQIAGPNLEKRKAVGGFLDRVAHELRNPGVTPRDRAINYAATHAA
jgi:hypothetical protein